MVYALSDQTNSEIIFYYLAKPINQCSSFAHPTALKCKNKILSSFTSANFEPFFDHSQKHPKQANLRSVCYL